MQIDLAKNAFFLDCNYGKLNSLMRAACIFFGFLSACASTNPEKIPDIDGRTLPPLKMASLKPRNLDVTVVNVRKINEAAGNAKEVENLILGQISQSLNQGGVSLYPSSENKMTFWLQDCVGASEEAECLLLKTEFSNSKIKHRFENRCQDQVLNQLTKNYSRGDVSRVYQDCLARQFETINKTFSLEARPGAP